MQREHSKSEESSIWARFLWGVGEDLPLPALTVTGARGRENRTEQEEEGKRGRRGVGEREQGRGKDRRGMLLVTRQFDAYSLQRVKAEVKVTLRRFGVVSLPAY